MAANEMALLGLSRVQEIFDDVIDNRETPGNLVFRSRVNKNEALDSDITAHFQSVGHIADIVADDQAAVTYQAARVKFDSNFIPNIKQGRQLTQTDLKMLETLGSATFNAQSNAYEAYFFDIATTLIDDIEMREEQMLVSMELGQFTYQRGDLTISVPYNIPAELNAVAVASWSDATNAKPISDIQNLALIRRVKYGRATNRIKMSTPAFVLLTKTNEFTAQVQRLWQNANVVAPSIPYQSINALQNLVGQILNMTVELIDHRYQQHLDTGGTPIHAPYLPLGKVILDDTANDRNDRVKDFAIGVVTESTVNDLLGGWVYGLTGEQFGPVTYITPTTMNLNPPGVVFWGVERGMPRKRDTALNAVLDVGTVTDIIPQGIPF
jgi:hypothetical protein